MSFIFRFFSTVFLQVVFNYHYTFPTLESRTLPFHTTLQPWSQLSLTSKLPENIFTCTISTLLLSHSLHTHSGLVFCPPHYWNWFSWGNYMLIYLLNIFHLLFNLISLQPWVLLTTALSWNVLLLWLLLLQIFFLQFWLLPSSLLCSLFFLSLLLKLAITPSDTRTYPTLHILPRRVWNVNSWSRLTAFEYRHC